MYVWDVSTGELLHTFNNHKGMVNAAGFSESGRLVVTASNDNTARIWDTSTGGLLHTLKHNDWVESAIFNESDSLVLTAANDGTANIWDVSNGNLLHTLEGRGAPLIKVKMNETWQQVMAYDGYGPSFWDARTGALQFRISQFPNKNWLYTDKYFRFDGTQEAQNLVTFFCGQGSIDFKEINKALYVPKLVERVIWDTFNNPKLQEMDICSLFPKINRLVDDSTHYRYLIYPGKGNISSLEVWMNGMRVKTIPIDSVRKSDDKYEFVLDKGEVAGLMLSGQDNNIRIKVLLDIDGKVAGIWE